MGEDKTTPFRTHEGAETVAVPPPAETTAINRRSLKPKGTKVISGNQKPANAGKGVQTLSRVDHEVEREQASGAKQG